MKTKFISIDAMSSTDLQDVMQSVKTTEVEASTLAGNYGYYTPIGSFGWDGEKNPGEIGVIKKYEVRYSHLTLRAWQNFIESDFSQAAIRKYVRWIVGAGLKLQAEPMAEVIQDLGLDFDKKQFTKQVEARFRLFSKSKRSSYSKQMTFNKVMEEAKKNAVVGGDVLVIMRTDEIGNVTVELVDAEHVCTPFSDSPEMRKDRESGCKIRYGVAYDKKTKEHKAYYIKSTDDLGYVRIPAYDSNGMKRAFLFYGLRYRLDSIRGIPLATACLQTIAQLDRYKEATVGSAEERQKIVYYVKHDVQGSGESIHGKRIQESIQRNLNRHLSTDQYSSEELNNLIATTTNKQAIDMPKGAELKSLASQNELSFGTFMKENLIILCATLQMPYEVAVSKYENNFSSSRAALKDWEHTIDVEREDMGENFCGEIYNFWLVMQSMMNRIDNSALSKAVLGKDYDLLEAICHSRWTGARVPHIDPVKEVNAERLKLGPAGANIPLTTPSKATEALGTGEFDENLARFGEQFSTIPDEFKPVKVEQLDLEDSEDEEDDEIED